MNRFLAENNEIPQALMHLVNFYKTEGREQLMELRSIVDGRRELIFCGMGTSEITPLYIQWRLANTHYSCMTMDASECFYYGALPAKEKSTIVLTSQSGESIELNNLLGRKEIVGKYVAITNDDQSNLARHARLILPLCAGNEESITTKTYTNNIALLHLIATVLCEPKRLEDAFSELELIAKSLDALDEASVQSAARLFTPIDSIAFVGRGFAYMCARQCALTFMEGVRCLTSAFTGGFFNHGPFEYVDENARVVVFRPRGVTLELIDHLLTQTDKVNARVVIFTDCDFKPKKNVSVIPVAAFTMGKSENFFPILASRAHNLFLYYLAKANGVEPGFFRYGSKITREE